MSLELIESAELSDLGLKRKNNEDACLRMPEKGVYCVADGMGGVVGGDVASKTIIANVQEAFAMAAPEQYGTLSGAVELLGAAVNKASKWIKDFADEKVIGQMGSTLVGLVFDPRNPSRAVVLHAGDSRLYRWRAGQLELLTADHTAAAALSATLGRDLASFPARYHNELARAVGLKETVDLEQSKVEAKTGDVFMLCSDGLPRMVPDPVIGQIFASGDKGDLDALSRALIQKAIEAGGKDNVTVVVMRVGDLSRFANVKPEQDDPPWKAAPPVASERDSTHADREVHNPPTPDTVRDDLAYTHSRTAASQKPPPVPPRPAPTTEIPPTPKPRSRGGGKIIAGVLVILAAGIMAFLFLPTKPSKPGAPPTVTNLPPPNPMPDVVTQPTNPAVPPIITNIPPARPAPEVVTQPTNLVVPNPIVVTPPPPPPTGGLLILSDAAKVDVYKDGQKVGETPYKTNALPPGSLTYQLGNLTRTGMVTMTVVAGGTNTTNVNLTTRTGTLVVNSDPPHAEIWMAGKRVGYTPFSSNWDVGDFLLTIKYLPLGEIQAPMTVAADTSSETNVFFPYGGVEIKSDPSGADVLINGKVAGPTPFRLSGWFPGLLAFQLRLTNYEPCADTVLIPNDHSFAEKNIQLHPVAVAPAIAEVKPVGTGLVVTNEGRVVWTNRFGMVFFKMPDNEFWIEMALATPQQFHEVAGVNNQTTPKISIDQAGSFASNLTAVLQKNNEFPPGCETWQFAIPTTNQWQLAADIKSLEFKKEKQYEWCRNATTQESKLFYARYNEDAGKFVIKEIVLSDAPDGLALRLVLAPPGPLPHPTR